MNCRIWPLLALLLAGCSKHIPVDSDCVRDEINQRATEKQATVVLIDGSRLHGKWVELSDSTLAIQGLAPEHGRTIPLDSLQRLCFTYHLKGMGTGMAYGATTEALILVLVLHTYPLTGFHLKLALIGLVSGGIKWGVVGLVLGYNYYYQFHPHAGLLTPTPAREIPGAWDPYRRPEGQSP